jgi:hypothetical protein
MDGYYFPLMESIPTSEKIAVLRAALRDIRRMYDHISNTYDQLRLKSIGLIAGEIALVAFIFAANNLAIPHQYYGRVFSFRR